MGPIELHCTEAQSSRVRRVNLRVLIGKGTMLMLLSVGELLVRLVSCGHVFAAASFWPFGEAMPVCIRGWDSCCKAFTSLFGSVAPNRSQDAQPEGRSYGARACHIAASDVQSLRCRPGKEQQQHWTGRTFGPSRSLHLLEQSHP